MQDILRKLKGEGLGAVLARGASSAFFIQLLGSGVLFFAHVYLARILGAGQYGIYVYVISWLAVLVLLAKMGLDEAVLRHGPAYRAGQEWGLWHGLFRRATQLTCAFSTGVAILLALVTWALRGFLGRELTVALWIGCGALLFQSLTYFYVWALRSLRHVATGLSCLLLVRPVLFVILVAGATLFVSAPSADMAMVAHLAAFAGAAALAASLFGYYGKRETQEAKPEIQTRRWLATALPLVALNGFYLLNARAGVLVTGALAGTTEAGVYAVSTRLAGLIAFGLMAVNSIVAPLISELHATGRRRDLQRVLSYAAVGISAFTIPAALLMGIVGHWLLLIFGGEFVVGYPALLVLIAGQTVNSLAGSVAYLLIMTGHQNRAAAIMGMGLVVNIGLCFALVPVFGAMGAALGTAVGMFVWNGGMYAWARLRLDLDPTLLGLRRTGK